MTTYRVDWIISHRSGLSRYQHLSRRGAFKETSPVDCNEDSFIRGLAVRAKRILNAFMTEGTTGKIEIRKQRGDMSFGNAIFEDTVTRRMI